MEQLISDIEAFCARFDMAPQKLLRDVINSRWGLWEDWKAGISSPTMRNADRIRDHMAKVAVAHVSAHANAIPTRQGKVPKKQAGAA